MYKVPTCEEKIISVIIGSCKIFTLLWFTPVRVCHVQLYLKSSTAFKYYLNMLSQPTVGSTVKICFSWNLQNLSNCHTVCSFHTRVPNWTMNRPFCVFWREMAQYTVFSIGTFRPIFKTADSHILSCSNSIALKIALDWWYKWRNQNLFRTVKHSTVYSQSAFPICIWV